MTRSKKPAAGNQPNTALIVEQTSDETGAQALARKMLEPHLGNAVAASEYAKKPLVQSIDMPGVGDFIDHLQTVTAKAERGDVAIASRMLAAQAVTLDNMFAELARRAALNMGEYLDAAERYGRLALKAQANCRTTLESLAKLHQPREQTVRHVHVNEGGQAIVADQFHQHTGGRGNAESVKQSHATGGERASLPCPDPLRNEVPIPGCAREAAMQDARGDQPGGTQGEP